MASIVLDWLCQNSPASNAHGARDGKPLSAKSVRNVALLIHAALTSARKKGKVALNVADNCEMVPTIDRSERETQMAEETWTPEQLRSFLAHVHGTRDYPLYLLLAGTGARRGEALGLSWNATDLEDGAITIGQTLVLVDNRVTVKPNPKSDARAATIALDDDTVAALREHRARQNRERLQAGALWRDTGLVFTDELGEPLHPETTTKRFQRAAKAAGLPPCRLHSLRHAYTSLLLEEGVAMEVISKRLRHSDLDTTSRLYAHYTRTLDREVAKVGVARLIRES